MQLTTNQINSLKRYFAGIPVKKAFLFGSYSRNEADEKSDIDIMVELDYSQHIGFKFFSYQQDISDLLQRKVDVVTTDGISRHIRPFVDRDKILIYERAINR